MFWVLDGCYGSTLLNTIVIVGLFAVCYSGLKPWITTINTKAKMPSVPIQKNPVVEERSRTHREKKKIVLTYLQPVAALFSIAQQFSINSKLLQTSVFDLPRYLPSVLAANAF